VNISKRNLILISLTLLIFLVVAFLLFFFVEENIKLSSSTTIEKDVLNEVKNLKSEELKVREFVERNLHKPVLNSEISVNWNEGNPKEFPMQLLYTSLVEKDIDLLTSAFTGEALQDLWEAGQSYNQRVAILEDFIHLLSREGTLNRFSYKFEKDQFKLESNKGEFQLEYTDKTLIKIPFEFQKNQNEEGEGEYYQIKTSLSEIQKIIIACN